MPVQTHPFMTNIERMKRSIKETASWLLGVFGSILVGVNNWMMMERLRSPKKPRAMTWKGKKSKEVVSTEKLTRNVPWSAIAEIAPYEEEYGPPFRHIRYRVRMEYSITTVKYSSRVKERETMILNCPTRQDLADVVASLKVLTGR